MEDGLANHTKMFLAPVTSEWILRSSNVLVQRFLNISFSRLLSTLLTLLSHLAPLLLWKIFILFYPPLMVFLYSFDIFIWLQE